MDAIIAALSTPRRREILRLVWREERSAGEIHRALPDVTFGAVSQHLKLLEAAGLVGRRREGRQRFYLARPERLAPFREWLESTWDGALYRLKLRAELEEARRGPAPRPRLKKKQATTNPTKTTRAARTTTAKRRGGEPTKPTRRKT
ncbi:MAG TPA: metalloregulator ArsR/SmtB family transcription factor [Kofleriaceae bacterium]|nr:metalloregulator ArsR/SmtB family transcription factor [Kofleriaceae bacterium]